MSVYQSIFDLISNYIYGGVSLTPEMYLSNTLLSTILSMCVVVFPIVIVFWIAKFILKGYR